MIPKVIHYCWFGGNPLPKDALKCIESWKRYCPNYEIKQWNESNVDFNECMYAKEAYNEKKWAFVSDYVRFKILYEQGGLYFDTDVELIRSIDHIVLKGPFMGCENDCSPNNDNKGVNPRLGLGVAPGLGLGVAPGLGLYREILDFYKKIHFQKSEETGKYKTVVEYTTELLQKHGLKNINEVQCVEGVFIYPKEYFQPMDLLTGKIYKTKKTVSIHHYAGSWLDQKGKRRGAIYKLLKKLFGNKIADFIRKFFSRG